MGKGFENERRWYGEKETYVFADIEQRDTGS